MSRASALRCAFSPDGNWLGSINSDCIFQLTDAHTAQVVREKTLGQKFSERYFLHFGFSSSSPAITLITGREKSGAHTWEIATDRILTTTCEDFSMAAVHVSDESYLTCGIGKGLQWLDVDDGEVTSRPLPWLPEDSRLVAVGLSPDRKRLAISVGRSIEVWDRDTHVSMYKTWVGGFVRSLDFIDN